jgi:2-dehydro-3-deoxyphosphogluconate aldolase/(4S)-4-hydroxy-2-oxoglutarate aldolase
LDIREIVSLVPVIPVLTITEFDHALPVAQALVAGGVNVIEVALRTSVALAAIRAMRESIPSAIIGIGTLTQPQDFAAGERAGAQFGVTPGFNPNLAASARSARFPLLPGVMTPSEVLTARESGFKVLKLFPAHQAGGPGFLRAMASVFPDVIFCPTGGITPDTAREYLSLSNVACVCGSWLVPHAMMVARDWAGIEALASAASKLRQSSNGAF